MRTKTKSKVKLPKQTRQQKQLEAAQLQLAERQISAIDTQTAFSREQFEALGPLIEQQEADAARARAEEERQAPIRQEIFDIQLANLRGGGEATPEQIRLIEEATGAALARGESDIGRFRDLSLEALREELAPQLGLRSTDTPILDRGSRVAEEAVRQQGQLALGLRGAAAEARLNFPLAVQGVQGVLGESLAASQEGNRRFSEELRQSAFSNRQALTALTGSFGTSLALGIPASITAGVAANNQLRLGASTRTTSTSGLGNALDTTADLFKAIGGVRQAFK